VPRKQGEDSDPVLEVSASGTADSNGEYLQHDAVAPHKPHLAEVAPMTVIVRRDSLRHALGALVGAVTDAATTDTAMNTKGTEAVKVAATLADAATAPDEITSVTKAGLRANGWNLFRVLSFVETQRITTLMFVVGGLLLLAAALLATR